MVSPPKVTKTLEAILIQTNGAVLLRENVLGIVSEGFPRALPFLENEKVDAAAGQLVTDGKAGRTGPEHKNGIPFHHDFSM